MKIKAISLFSGCGGDTLGMEQARIKVVGFVEFNKYAIETHINNFPYSVHIGSKYDGDINLIPNKIFKKYRNKIDVIFSGFPCQGFSMAGKRDKNDPRNKLYLRMLKIIKIINPKIIICENVKGFVSFQRGAVLNDLIKRLKEIGYNVDYKILNAVNYGVPQKRERIIILGNRINKKNIFPKFKNTKQKTLGEAIKRFINIKENPKINHTFTKHKEKFKIRISNVKEGESLYKNFSDAWKKSPWNEPSNTIKENHGGVNLHPKLPRVLTPRELASLQSFPDNFIFFGSKKQQLIQIGNAIPPLLAKEISLEISKILH